MLAGLQTDGRAFSVWFVCSHSHVRVLRAGEAQFVLCAWICRRVCAGIGLWISPGCVAIWVGRVRLVHRCAKPLAHSATLKPTIAASTAGATATLRVLLTMTSHFCYVHGSFAILLSVPMKQSKRRPARHRAINDNAAIAAQCARKLLALRGQARETQKQLAWRLRMTESMISRLERGDHVPSLKTLCRIADAFGRNLEIVFHQHPHDHADGTRHSHPHGHGDPDHQHHHGEKE